MDPSGAGRASQWRHARRLRQPCSPMWSSIRVSNARRPERAWRRRARHAERAMAAREGRVRRGRQRQRPARCRAGSWIGRRVRPREFRHRRRRHPTDAAARASLAEPPPRPARSPCTAEQIRMARPHRPLRTERCPSALAPRGGESTATEHRPPAHLRRARAGESPPPRGHARHRLARRPRPRSERGCGGNQRAARRGNRRRCARSCGRGRSTGLAGL